MTSLEFYESLQQDVRARAESVGTFSESAFFDLACEHLSDAGSIADVTPCHYKTTRTKINGYAFAPDEATLDLYLVLFSGGAGVATLARKDLDAQFVALETFLESCLSPGFAADLETSHPVYGLVRQIAEELSVIRRVRFFLITDSTLSTRVKDVASKKRDGREWVYRVWDLDRLQKVMETGEPEEVVVDFLESFGEPLRCLPAGIDSADVRSFLAAIPGDWLSEIYGEWSGRLLEQNVRSFLQLKGGVNKGIRNTILTEPHHFFPYNNGISATASEIEMDSRNGVIEIRRLRNFQIVNGGQTTASLFNSMKRDGADVSGIRVQMKLTVVSPEKVNELVPKISRFANSQNKVGDADFFSNHPFHVRIESLSRRVAAPAVGSSQINTHWFYERVRGQYANAQLHLTPAAKGKFSLQNPRHQVIVKTDLAKYENTFRQLPYEVSRGSQKNFLKFADFISQQWTTDETRFSDHWFQIAVAHAILFRASERIIEKAAWYAKGFRAQIVTYSLALLTNRITATQKDLDYLKIWRRQGVSSEFESSLDALAEAVQATIISSSLANGVSNVTEWCKRPGCWDDVKKVQFPVADSFSTDIVSATEIRELRDEARRDRKTHSDAEAAIAAVELGAEYWKRVLTWARKGAAVTPEDIKVLTLATAIPGKLPNALQSRRLLTLRDSYLKEGGG